MAAAPTGTAPRPERGMPVGLALVRDAEVLGTEPFFHEFIAGIERVLVPLGVPVLLQVVATVPQAGERMRAWARHELVQGLILIDLLPGDERVALAKELGLPSVVIGDPVTAEGLPTVWTQDDVAMRGVVAELVAAGHTHLGHVGGPAAMAHTIIRRRTFEEVAAEHGVRTTTFDGDYSEAAGVRAVTALADLAERPTVLVFDNDVMALGALHEAGRRDLAVPADLALIAWDDSALCQLAVPPLSAVSHDVQELGELVGNTLVGALSAEPPRVVDAAPARLIVRGSGLYVATATATVEEFDRRIDPYRSELLAHCYRMLGSVHDAEDLVQETYLRAWRAKDRYDESRSSLRTWLYRIATNACLTALEGRSRRPLPSGLVAESDPRRPLVHGGEITWLQPLPDSQLSVGEPETATLDRGSLRLAFVAALQHLSAQQRAVLILREVLDFSAAEAAQILSTTTASVNSSLQRARARLKEAGILEEQVAEPSEAEQRAWVDKYMKAFEKADVEGLTRLLTEDVLMEMPPMVNWFVGRENYGVFMDWVFATGGRQWRFLPVGANSQPAFAAYNRGPSGAFELHTLQVFTVTKNGISRNSVFRDAEVFASFKLPAELEA